MVLSRIINSALSVIGHDHSPSRFTCDSFDGYVWSGVIWDLPRNLKREWAMTEEGQDSENISDVAERERGRA